MLATLAQMMDQDDMRDGGGHWWGWLIGLVIAAAIVVLVTWIVVRMTRTPSRPPETPRSIGGSAEDVLAGRLARGEIDAREYRERLAVLREHG